MRPFHAGRNKTRHDFRAGGTGSPAINPRHVFSRRTLLAGSSLLALVLAAPQPANAKSLGGGALFSAPNFANDAAQAAAQQAAAVAKQSQSALARATQAIQAMQAAQSAARNLAISGPNSLGAGLPPVTNGLSAGGLIPDSGLAAPGQSNPVTSWINAKTPTQTASNGQITVTVQQTAPQALLNWQQFNIGRNTTLVFDQGGHSNYVALNKINDPSGVPSQILGSIKADGSVYLINQNGIIFGGSSQINVHTLIASSLNLTNISNFLSGKGILSDGTSTSFHSVDDNKQPYSAGDVTVQAGAQITAPGGDVLLLAPNVTNNGAISTPSGQALLFGGSDVLLSTGDSYLRGFVVLPNPKAQSYPNGPQGNYSSTGPGTAVNIGSISAPQGNITIVGGQVTQNGVLISTTSTTNNGSIILRAETGTLLLGGANDNPLYASYGVAGQPSLIQILPDAGDQSRITDTQAVANSGVALTGVNVDLKGIIQLRGYDNTNTNDHPGGIAIVATGTNQAPVGQVFLEDGSLLDASGTTDAIASASRNSVAVELRSNELADSPLVKAGPLYQQTIYVDASVSGTNPDGSIWTGTPLANAGAWIALTTRSLEERMMNGAPITIGGALNANDNKPFAVNLVQARGSVINIAGGYLSYAPGFVRVSSLLTTDGRRVSAANADPNVTYAGLCCSFTVNHAHWGVKEIYSSSSRRGYDSPGYIQGGAGGSLTLAVSAAILAGQVYSPIVVGEKQRTLATAPPGAGLTVNSTNNNVTGSGRLYISYNADDIILSDGAAQWLASFDIGNGLDTLLASKGAAANSVYIPPSWLQSGVTSVSLGANDTIALPAGNPITLPAGGSFSASANTVDIASPITVPSGSIALTAAYTKTSANLSTATFSNNGSLVGRSGLVTIEAGASLSTAGLWTSDRGGAQTTGQGAIIAPNGGTIILDSYFGDIDLARGTILNVSGGGYETAAGKVTAGNGGTLTLAAGLIPSHGASDPSTSVGQIYFDGNSLGSIYAGQFQGYGLAFGTSVGRGGTLNIVDTVVATIGASARTGDAILSQLAPAIDDAGNTYAPLTVSTGFFSSGGFTSISLTAAGIRLPSDVTLAPTVSSLTLPATPASSVTSLAGIAVPTLLGSGVRPASSIALSAKGDLWNRGGVSITQPYQTQVDPFYYSLDIAGTIRTDPKGSVSLTGNQIAIVSGTVDVPAGSIALGGGTVTYLDSGQQQKLFKGEGVWLTGTLSAAGTAISAVRSNGQSFNDVLPGGQVTVSGGDIILAPGSLIDVSGASGPSSLLAAGSFSSSGGGLFVRAGTTTVASSGGVISISATLGAVLEGALSSHGGGSAAGGTLNLTLAGHGGDVNGPTGIWRRTEDTAIILEPTTAGSYYLSTAQIGTPGTDLGAFDAIIDAHIPLSAQMLRDGGIASLVLSTPDGHSPDPVANVGFGYVTFSGNTSLVLPAQLTINTGTIIVPSGTTETLQANYIQWNNAGGNTVQPGMSTGSGALNLVANTVDLVGNLAVQGAQITTFTVGGDLRLTGVDAANIATLPQLYGSLVSAGQLVFKAGQVYPSTDSVFSLNSTFASTSIAPAITFLANGTPPQTPLSAGGVLNVFADDIEQGGTLRAPTGTIRLGAKASNDTGTLAGIVPVASNPNISAAAAAFGEWDFTTTGQTFVPGQSVALTNSGTTVNGVVSSLRSHLDSAGNTVWALAVNVTSVTGTTIGANVPPGTWVITAPGTTKLNLNAGSLTSVSAGGNTVLYGYTQNSSQWYYNANSSVLAVTAPPAKIIDLNGKNISVASGAVYDASGGGDLYAGEFVQGTGGSQNIFIGANKYIPKGTNVYAVIPGYTGIAAYDPQSSIGSPALGKQVYLNGAPGLPAGLYTLLPSQYAELPGAFLVTVQTAPGAGTAAATRSAIPPSTLADGSTVTSGYLVTPGSGTTDEHWSIFKVMPDRVARRYTEIGNSYANSFFSARALANGTAIPRLPQDGGQLLVVATGSLSFQGSGNFAPAAGGLGGLADISADQILVVDSKVLTQLAALTPGSAAYQAALAAYIPGVSVGGSAQAFVTGTSSTSMTVTAGDQSFIVQALTAPVGFSISAGQDITLTDSTGQNSMTGTVKSYNATTGALVMTVTSTTGSGTYANWTIDAIHTNTWSPIVLAASDLGRLGVESLLLGGTRSFESDGIHVSSSASQIVVANDSCDKIILPDIQLVAKPETVSNIINSGSPGASLTLTSTKMGTGQVVIAPGAAIVASGAVAPGGVTTYILSESEVAPLPQGNAKSSSYNGTSAQAAIGNKTDFEDYYRQVAENQIAYVRLSGGGLITTSGGAATYAGVPAGPVRVEMENGTLATLALPTYSIYGAVSVGAGAQLTASTSLTLFANGSGKIAPGVAISAQQAEFKSNQISLGTENYALPGLVLDQAALNGLAKVSTLRLVSAGTINVYGGLSLGEVGANGQPILGSLTFDAAGLVAQGTGAATFTAEQVTFQNTSGAAIPMPPPVAGSSLLIAASDVLALDPSGAATGYNNAKISLGIGAFGLAGFSNVDLKSSGRIIVTGDGGSLAVQAPLTLDAPRIDGGTMSIVNGLPQFSVVSYAITAADNPANPTAYYTVNLVNSSGTVPALPTALLGNKLTITAGQTNIDTDVALPGGAFNATANGGNDITVGSRGAIDVSGQAVRFGDILATIGGGNINLTSTSGAIAIQAGAILNVSNLADVGAVNHTSAGTVTLSAPVGGVTIAAGTLQGQGVTADRSGSFVLDTNSLAPSLAQNYDALASLLVAGGFELSWNIRARTGDINMTGLTQARNVSVSTDTGNIDVTGTIDASGATGGKINLWAGNNLTLEASAVLNAHGTVADANGRGGQVWLAAAQAWDGTATTTSGITLNVGAKIDVGVDALNGGVSAPVFGGATKLIIANTTYDAASTSSLNLGPVVGAGTSYTSVTQPGLGLTVGQVVTFIDSTGKSISGKVTSYDNQTGALAIAVTGENVPSIGGSVTFSTARNATGVNLNVTGGTFANFLSGVRGESAWDGVVVVGNQVYSYNDTTLYLTPTKTVAPSGGVETAAFTTYLNDATNFMTNQSAMWSTLGADGNGVVNGVYNSTSGVYAHGVLVNIRPGIVIKNSGAITVEGDSTNPNGIDLSGSAYLGSVLNTGDRQTLNGHFGQYDEPIVLAIRAAGDLNFGMYNGATTTLTLGSLSDGFSQYYNNGTSVVPLYASPGNPSPVNGAGASGAATLFDPAAPGAYNGLSGGLGANSASYFLTAGADTSAADPRMVNVGAAAGTVTVAGTPGQSGNNQANSVTADPLYGYNYDTDGALNGVTLANFKDYASFVRTGTGNIAISAAKDLVLQSPLSLIYTAGTGYNVNGSSAQPLSGFIQYNGMLTVTGQGTPDTLPASTFPTHGGDVTLAIGGNIAGDMNANVTDVHGRGTDQNLPYDMTALGSQLKLQNWIIQPNPANGMGSFSDLYATDGWMNSSLGNHTYYTLGGPATKVTPGNYQLAWYTWFPYLENTIGSFGGGNISVKAGGSISNVQFVSPTNARGAGPALVASSYAFDANLLTNPTDVALSGAAAIHGGYSGLYVQGGGNISVTAGSDITGVYTYAQNGKTTLQAGGSATQLVLSTSTGDISVEAGRSINIADQIVEPSLNNSAQLPSYALSGISLIQNGSFLINIKSSGNVFFAPRSSNRENTVLTGLLTSVPTGSVTLEALGSVTLGVGTPASPWNTNQGVLPTRIHLVSLQGDVTNNARFITYPDPKGTVDLLARGSVTLNSGFVLSDADPGIMPTLTNIAAALAPYRTPVTSTNAATSTLAEGYLRIGQSPTSTTAFPAGGAVFLPGQDTKGSAVFSAGNWTTVGSGYDVLGGDSFGQVVRDGVTATTTVPPATEAERHAGLHVGDLNPVRIIAVNGDVISIGDPEINVAKQTNVYAGRDVVDLRLLGQNNDASDITSVIAGRDVIYQAPILSTAGDAFAMPPAVQIGGPGNLLIESGRNTDLGNSTGLRTFGNFLNPLLPSRGANITIQTGLGNGNMLDTADFIAQYVNPATAAANPFAEPIQLVDLKGNVIGSGADLYAILRTLSPEGQQILLNQVFFPLIRDSGREHTGAIKSAFLNYQRAFAAIGTYLPSTTSSGSFFGGLSTVRTLAGGDITVLAPHGEIQVGLVAPPSNFPGYSVPGNPIWALNFGIVTEKGGNVDLYADRNISVNQSRVFTLEGGDMIVASLTGNIDAGKGAKTVQAVQPPNVSYDTYGNITITPFGPSSGSGLAVLRALPGVPLGNVDLIAPAGFVDAGDAGIRSSGNLNIAAVQVLNAGNIQVGGSTTGVPVVQAPNIGALTTASNAAGAAAKTDTPTGSTATDQPSIIIVEFLGFGGGSGDEPADQGQQRPKTDDKRSYNPADPVKVVGYGAVTEADGKNLTEEEKRRLSAQ